MPQKVQRGTFLVSLLEPFRHQHVKKRLPGRYLKKREKKDAPKVGHFPKITPKMLEILKPVPSFLLPFPPLGPAGPGPGQFAFAVKWRVEREGGQ